MKLREMKISEDMTACEFIPDCNLCPERHDCIYFESTPSLTG